MSKPHRDMGLHVTNSADDERFRELDRQQGVLRELVKTLQATVEVLGKQVDVLGQQVAEHSALRREFDALRQRIAAIGDVLTTVDPDRQ